MNAEATLVDAIDGISEQRMQIRADGGLRCRWSPRLINGVLLNNIIGVIPDLEVVIVYPQVTHLRDGYDWILSLSSLGYGWIARQFLRIPVEADEPLPENHNHIGWHILPGAPKPFLDLLRRLHHAQRPVPVVTLVFVDKQAAFSVEQINDASPSTVVIARDLRGKDYHAEDLRPTPKDNGWDYATREDGRKYFEANKSGITADMRRADYIQIRDQNEPGEGVGINDWFHGVLDGADAMGIKIAVYNFSVGNPGLPGDPRPYADFWRWDSTRELLRRVKQDGHAFCLHQYTNASWADEFTMLRHRKIYPLLPPDLRDIKLWVNECGESYKWAGTPRDRDAGRYYREMKGLQRELTGDPGDPDVCLWTIGLGSEEWLPDRIDHVLGVYEKFALEVAA